MAKSRAFDVPVVVGRRPTSQVCVQSSQSNGRLLEEGRFRSMEKKIRVLENIEWKNQEKYRYYQTMAQPNEMQFDLMASRISVGSPETPPVHGRRDKCNTKINQRRLKVPAFSIPGTSSFDSHESAPTNPTTKSAYDLSRRKVVLLPWSAYVESVQEKKAAAENSLQ